MNIKEVTKLTGLTSKTLRHWEKIGLLNPTRAENDYRLYQPTDLTRIFYIMNLRQLDVPLSEISEILSTDLDEKTALITHLKRLENKQNQLSHLINTLTQKLNKGDYHMSKEDFEYLKKQELNQNEKTYGQEIRTKYGVEMIEKSNTKYLEQTEESHQWAKDTHHKIIQILEEAYANNNQSLAQEAVKLHKEWLEFYWPEGTLSKEAHINLAQMYCEDERFRANYNQKYSDLPEFFRDAITEYYQI